MTRVPKLAKLAVVCFHMFLYLHNNAVGEELKKMDEAPLHDVVKNPMERQHLKKREAVAECKDGYELVRGSTMCAVDSEYYVVGSAGVSDEDIQIILKTHNDHRADVSPTARNMMKAYWDDELAKTAEKWAKQCNPGHDAGLGLTNYMPKYRTVSGQNAFRSSEGGSSDWKHAVDDWHSEIQLYVFDEDPEEYIGKDGTKKVGHYAQLVWNNVMLIGCGYAKCSNDWENFLVCNYVSGRGHVRHPYDDGTSCGDCPDSCNEKLCDCGDNFCFNWGKLDINTCQCACRFPWKGPRCLEHPCNYLSCKNGGTLNVSTCECECIYPWTGESCQTKECVEQVDPRICGTRWPPALCKKYSNIPQVCTVMCGICPDPCPDLRCEHGELVLENEQCRCNCDKVYTGDRCDIKDCPLKLDRYPCGPGKFWPPITCEKVPTVPGECPIMCGVCPDPCNGLECTGGGKLTLHDDGKCSCE